MDEISPACKEAMKFLGNFGPTVDPKRKLIKGYMIDPEGDAGKVYLTSDDLRGLATSCIEMADWLDKRAHSACEKSDV